MPHGKRKAPAGRAKDFGASMRKLLRYCKKYTAAVAVGLALAVLGAVCTIIGPDRISDLTGVIEAGIFGAIDLGAVGSIALSLVALYGCYALFSYVQGFIMSTVTQRVSQRLRSDISQKINRLPLRYFDTHSYGDVLSRVTNDVDTISQTINQSVAALVTAVVTLLGSLAMMLVTNVHMTLTAVLASLAGFVLMIFIMGRSQKYFLAQQQVLGSLNGNIEEVYSGHDVIKAYNAERKVTEEFEALNVKLFNSAWRAQFFSGLMMPIMSFIGNFGYVAVCVVGAVLVQNGTIGFATIVAFIMYVRLFTNPLSQIAQAANSLQAAAAASERVFEFLDEPELSDESQKTRRLVSVKGEVEFDHVKFGYDPERIIIHDFSAKVKPGQKIAIVGPTGAGKTTMVNLLMRFYELNGGQILIDGVPTSELTRENVHELFCMVLQDTWLFEGTIRENIAYAKKGVTDGQLDRACRAAGLDHFIHTLPKGYDTVLNDKASLSAGQKQLITIARAIVEDAPLLILDEATSSVDTRTEVLIQQAMDRLTEGRTSFVIAHRLSTIKNADCILVMKDGDIIESGTHDELLKNGGFYAELYNSQFETA